MSEPLVVVGNGMASTRFVDELMQRARGRYSVIVIGAEPRLSGNTPSSMRDLLAFGPALALPQAA
jgi:NAD(P)H-nitrite reductase large subunit